MASLVKKIDSKIGENDALKSFVVILTDKGEKATDDLRKLAKDAGIQHIPLTLHQDPAGPPDYEIARDADVTIVMWNEGKVKVNRAYKGELTAADVRDIVADIPKLLDD